MSKLFAGVAALALFAGSASAATITFGGAPALDGSFLTTANLAAMVETFDPAPGQPNFVTITGSFTIADDNIVNRRAAPAFDETFYLAIPDSDSTVPGSATISFTGLGSPITYLGFYYGSIDDENTLQFRDADGNVIMTNFGEFISGAQIRAAGADNGDQIDRGANRYVNINFDDAEGFDHVIFSTSKFAFEVDNIAWAAQAVPEPATLALFGLGLLGMAAARRRR